MEIGKLNAYYLKSELKVGKTNTEIAQALLCSATEEKLQDVVDEYLFNHEDPKLPELVMFLKNKGHYATFLDREVFVP
ncbi:MAG: hypothetical protein CVV28_10375 [Methanobacteriales archaeon HGW-Methanobacteriales-1]|nr:MAG: hypothetical protein CVV28_10375 [Methanobacteriales archaeon HGW-Methanobacteriales-1]